MNSKIKAILEEAFLKLEPNVRISLSRILISLVKISLSEQVLVVLILLNKKLFKRYVSWTADFKIAIFHIIAWSY